MGRFTNKKTERRCPTEDRASIFHPGLWVCSQVASGEDAGGAVGVKQALDAPIETRIHALLVHAFAAFFRTLLECHPVQFRKGAVLAHTRVCVWRVSHASDPSFSWGAGGFQALETRLRLLLCACRDEVEAHMRKTMVHVLVCIERDR
jgi:hypothetical protein